MSTNSKNKIGLKEPTFVKDESFYENDSLSDLKFPKQFKRNWWQQWDLRFSIILFITCVLEIGLIILLTGLVKSSAKKVNVQKIQKRYAHLLLRDEVETDISPFTNEKEDAKLHLPNDALSYGESEIGGGESEVEEAEGIASDRFAEATEKNLSNYNLHTLEERKGSREEKESRFVSARTREVNQKGVLQYMADDAESSFDQELSDIFTHGQNSKENLSRSSKNVKLAGFQNAGSNNTDLSDGGTAYFVSLKGSKSTASLTDELSSLTPLRTEKLDEAQKNVDFDIEEESLLPDRVKRKPVRTTEYVTQVLLSHKRVIQDCYKQAIKRVPDLKGKIEVRILVHPEGYVDEVQVVNSTIEDESMLRCVISRIRRWRDFGKCDEEIGVVGYRQTYVFGY